MNRPAKLVVALLLALPAIALAGCLQTAPTADAPLDGASGADAASMPTAASVYLPGTAERAPEALTELADGILPEGVPLPVGALRYSGAESFEPTLGVGPDGAIYLSTFEPATPSPWKLLMRSRDQGLTWEDVTPMLPGGATSYPPQSNDPYIYVDPDTGRLFLSDLQMLICSTLSLSDDGGETWTPNPAGCGVPPGVHDHQTVGSGKPRLPVPTVGYPNVVYYCINRVGDSSCASSRNGGLTFGPLVTVYPGVETGGVGPEAQPTLCGGLHAHVATGPDGTVYLPKGHCGRASVAISKDDGATWSIVTIDTEHRVKGHEVAFAVDEAGHAYAFWIGAEDRKPWLAASADGGETWGEPIMVAPPGVATTDFPTIAAGAEGRIALAYYGTAADKDYDQMEGGDTWNAYLTVITDALAATPTLMTVTVNDPADPVARGVCGNTRCNGVGDFIDVVIGPDGRPWAAFVDVCNDQCAAPDGVENAGGNLGLVGTLAVGPALRGELAALPALPELPLADG